MPTQDIINALPKNPDFYIYVLAVVYALYQAHSPKALPETKLQKFTSKFFAALEMVNTTMDETGATEERTDERAVDGTNRGTEDGERPMIVQNHSDTTDSDTQSDG